MTAELVAEFEKRFPKGPLIQGALRLPTDASSVTTLFGPSGSGKTTILRCLAGLDRPDRGVIRFGEETWFDAGRGIALAPQRRGIGYLFQEYALFPHLSVVQNIAYGLRAVRAPERRRRVQEVVDLLGLAGLEDRLPKQLSGGEQQRVALARALVPRPRLLLLDEPLSALDAPTREQLRGELRTLLAQSGIPALLVTHDRIEASALGDRVVVLHNGRVCQSGPVREVFTRPASPAVARIVGVDTVEPAKVLQVRDGLATLAVGEARLAAPARGAKGEETYVCIRAEDVILEKGDTIAGRAGNRLAGRIRTLCPEGPMVRIRVDCGFRLTALVTNQACAELGLREGERVTAVVRAPAIHLIPRG